MTEATVRWCANCDDLERACKCKECTQCGAFIHREGPCVLKDSPNLCQDCFFAGSPLPPDITCDGCDMAPCVCHLITGVAH